MGGGGVAPSIPRADMSASGRAALPVSRDDRATPGADDVVVLIKIGTTDPALFRQAENRIRTQLAGQQVAGRGICIVIADDSAEMSVTTKQELASHITPQVASALGVTLIK